MGSWKNAKQAKCEKLRQVKSRFPKTIAENVFGAEGPKGNGSRDSAGSCEIEELRSSIWMFFKRERRGGLTLNTKAIRKIEKIEQLKKRKINWKSR